MKIIAARTLRWWWTGCAGLLAVYHFQGMLHAANSHFAQNRVSAEERSLQMNAPVLEVAQFQQCEDQSADPESSERVDRVCRVTAYCDRGLTAAGTLSGVGQCAAPEDIPFGTVVYIPALDRSFVVTDRTHKRFRHNTVDIFIPTEEACREFGRNYLECEFHLPNEKWIRPKAPALLSSAVAFRAS